jgi:hypothetical protein
MYRWSTSAISNYFAEEDVGVAMTKVTGWRQPQIPDIERFTEYVI